MSKKKFHSKFVFQFYFVFNANYRLNISCNCQIVQLSNCPIVKLSKYLSLRFELLEIKLSHIKVESSSEYNSVVVHLFSWAYNIVHEALWPYN